MRFNSAFKGLKYIKLVKIRPLWDRQKDGQTEANCHLSQFCERAQKKVTTFPELRYTTQAVHQLQYFAPLSLRI
jgi:hypothetical protein